MGKRKERNEITDSRSRRILDQKYTFGLKCHICPPNKGCNKRGGNYGNNNNWKKHRKKQYRTHE